SGCACTNRTRRAGCMSSTLRPGADAPVSGSLIVTVNEPMELTTEAEPATPDGRESRPSFPRLSARTQEFTLGAPSRFTVAPDRSRVVFLRTPSGTERATELWVYDVEAAAERKVADPVALLAGDAEQISPEEAARRERSRERTV